MVTLGLFIDLQNAFDTVNHMLPFQKLEFADYLTNRQQYVQHGNNELYFQKCVLNGHITLSADVTSLFYTGNDLNHMLDLMQHDINNLSH
ncbi:hypothetical protein PR048_018491, partial [Dryococelus australis]